MEVRRDADEKYKKEWEAESQEESKIYSFDYGDAAIDQGGEGCEYRASGEMNKVIEARFFKSFCFSHRSGNTARARGVGKKEPQFCNE